MNEDRKPLSTQDIAAGRDGSATTPQGEIREETRAEMEKSYATPGMTNIDDKTNPEGASSGREAYSSALLPDEAAQSHREHWTDIQARFVDDPKDAVQQADELVAEVIQIVATRFADQRKGLESQWQQGGEASTEDLRQAFQQYRSFFERLLAA